MWTAELKVSWFSSLQIGLGIPLILAAEMIVAQCMLALNANFGLPISITNLRQN